MDQTKKVKVIVVGVVAVLAVAFAVYMILPSEAPGPSPEEIEAAQRAQEMVQAAEEATRGKGPAQPPPPVQIKGGFGPSSGQ